jgi:protein O-GlcNAc transferase
MTPLEAVEQDLSRGRAAEALASLEPLLASAPSAIAWNLQGRALVALGRRDEAAVAFERSAQLDPRFDRAWSNRAKIDSDRGRFDGALRWIEAGLVHSPRSVRLLKPLANVLRITGQPALACAALARLIAESPELAHRRELAFAEFASGATSRAFDTARAVWLETPSDRPLLALIVEAAGIAGRRAELAPVFAHAMALAVRPSDLLAVGALCASCDHWDGAARSARRALALDRSSPLAAVCLAEALEAQGDRDGALRVLREEAPHAGAPGPALMLAERLRATQDADGAAAILEAALLRFPDDASVLVAMADDLRCRAEFVAPLELLERAVRLDPRHASAHAKLGRQLMAARQPTRGLTHLEEAIRLDPRAVSIRADYLFELHNVPLPAPDLAALHQRFGAASSYARPVPQRTRSFDPERRLRLGYVSGDFREHSVAFFMLPILRHHDPKQVEVFLYGNQEKSDAMTSRIAGLGHHFRHVRGLSNQALAELVVEDEIDLLIDLSGMTLVERLGLYARRPAPVQLTYLGYPDTTGLPCVDYRITDGVADPVGLAEPLHSEVLLRLPEVAWCYESGCDGPPERTQPRGDRPVAFACFNTLAKVTDAMVSLWAEILSQVPGSTLLLKFAALRDPRAHALLRQSFVAAGIDADRLEFVPWAESRYAHLEVHHRVDIALDPSPYNGTTTTCDALWMGVPVVTLTGATHASRVGASLLDAVGLGDLVAHTGASYVAKAVALAADAPRRQRLRRELRSRFQRSPLGDPSRFVPAFEALLRQAWQRYVSERVSIPELPEALGVHPVDAELKAVSPADPFAAETRALLTLDDRGELELLRHVAAHRARLHDLGTDSGLAACAFVLRGGSCRLVRTDESTLQRAALHATANKLSERMEVVHRASLIDEADQVVADSSAVLRLALPWSSRMKALVERAAAKGHFVLLPPAGEDLAPIVAELIAVGLVGLVFRPGLRAWSPWQPHDATRSTTSLLVLSPAAQREAVGLTADADEVLRLETMAATEGGGLAGAFARTRALVSLGLRGLALQQLQAVWSTVGELGPAESAFVPPLPSQDHAPRPHRPHVWAELCALEALVKLEPAGPPSPHLRSLLERYEALGGLDLDMARRLALALGPVE